MTDSEWLPIYSQLTQQYFGEVNGSVSPPPTHINWMTLGAALGLAGLALLVSLLSGELAGPGIFASATSGWRAAVRRMLVAPKPNQDMSDAEAALQGDDIAFARLVVRSFEKMNTSMMDTLRCEIADMKRRRSRQNGSAGRAHDLTSPLPPAQDDTASGRKIARYVFKL